MTGPEIGSVTFGVHVYTDRDGRWRATLDVKGERIEMAKNTSFVGLVYDLVRFVEKRFAHTPGSG